MNNWSQKIAILLAVSLLEASVAIAEGPYHLLKEISVSGDENGKSLSIDEVGRRLYLIGESRVSVVDLQNDRVIGSITNANGVGSFALAPKMRRGFISSPQTQGISIYDIVSRREIAKMGKDKKATSLLLQPTFQEIYAFDQNDSSVSIFEADDGDFMKTVKLSGKPGFAVADQKTGRVYCNLEDKEQIAIFDAKSRNTTNSWPITPGKGSTVIAVDSARQRVFLGSSNKMLLMLDGNDGKVLSQVGIENGIEGIAFDPVSQFIFIAGGGTLVIKRVYTMSSLADVQVLPIATSSAAMAFDPMTHRLYMIGTDPQVHDRTKVLVLGIEKVPNH